MTMAKLCSAPRCLRKARKGQRTCRQCHARLAKKYRAKAKRELVRLRAQDGAREIMPV